MKSLKSHAFIMDSVLIGLRVKKKKVEKSCSFSEFESFVHLKHTFVCDHYNTIQCLQDFSPHKSRLN